MYKWQLCDLYMDFECETFQEDWCKLSTFNERLATLTYEDNLPSIEAAVSILEEYSVLARQLGSYINLQLAVDTQNKKATNYRTQFASLTSQLTKQLTQLRRFLSEIETDISKDQKLSDYQFFFNELQQSFQYQLDDEVEEIISKLNITGGQSWSSLQTYLTSLAEEDFKGKKLTLSELRNFAYSDSLEIRKEAFEAELKLYHGIKEPIAFAINNIKKQVNTISELRGYGSPLEATLIQSRMEEKTLQSLISSIETYLPEFQRYLRLKAEYLGYEQGLPFFELFAPIGNFSQKYTVEEAGQYLIKIFNTFSKDLANLVEESIKKKYIDFLPRKGKSGGAFCSNLPFIKQSRIMLNFDGSLSSLITMAHELGHAYHGQIIQDHLPLNWSYSMPVAETASTFNEMIVMNNLLLNASNDDEQLYLIESQLQDTTQIIVDIYSRYYFEKKLFSLTKNQFLFSEQLEELMIEAQKAAYGNGLDPDYLHPFMWLNKSHYYSTGLSYYNFPYAFGGLFARGLFSYYEEQSERFVKKYHELLYTTTIGSVEEVALKMGIDVSQKSFWYQSLETYVKLIDQFESLLKKG